MRLIFIPIHFMLLGSLLLLPHKQVNAQSFFNVKDVNTDPNGSSNPNNFTVCNNKLYFFAADNSHLSSLWVTLGTAATTQKIFPAVNFSNSISNMICFNNKLFFSYDDGVHGQELWTSDGTAAGTTLFIDLIPGSANSFPEAFTVCNNKLFFAALNNTGVYQLYVSDGTVAGTFLLRSVSVFSNESVFPQLNNELYFMSDGGSSTAYAIWKSDGTAAGTVLVKKDVYSSGEDAGFSTVLNSKLYFNGTEASTGAELWVTDGTTAGTQMVINLSADAGGVQGNGDPQTMKVLNGKIYFTGRDDAHGKELFATDGTTAGTYLVKDVVAGTSGSNPNQSIVYNGLLYFIAASTNELWKSDGTSAGTTLVKSGLTYGAGFKAVWNNRMYFTFVADYSLWQSDGTSSGTIPIKVDNTAFPITSYTDFGSDHSFTEYNSELYLNAWCYQISDGFEPSKLSFSALPLTWLGVQAQWQNTSQAKVIWQVAAQQNILKYTVQRSAEGISFEDACTTNATAQTQYSCLVSAPENKNYFRVKETDIDGRASYSKIILLQKNNGPTAIVSPNPAKDILHISNLPNNTTAQIIDVAGKLVQSHIIAGNKAAINISSLSEGSYFLKLISKAGIKTIQFIKD